MGAAIRNIPEGKVGIDSGIMNMSRAIGSVLGVAILVSVLNTALGHYSADAVNRIKQQIGSNAVLSAEVRQALLEQVGLKMQEKSSADKVEREEVFLQLDAMEKSRLSAAEESERPEIQAVFLQQRQDLGRQLSRISADMQDASVASFRRTFHSAGWLLLLGIPFALISDRRRGGSPASGPFAKDAAPPSSSTNN